MPWPRFAALAALGLLGPAAADAQQCGVGRFWVAAAAGASHYATAGGIDATEVGADVGFRVGPAAIQAGVRRVSPEGGVAEPDVARLSVAVPVVQTGRVSLCAVAHAGGSRFAAGDDEGTVVAGGLGLRLEAALARGRVLPFVEARGLGASLSGQLLGLDASASGASFGGEAGVAAVHGPVLVQAGVSVDGFDGGLGVTPYPDRLLRLALGFRF